MENREGVDDAFDALAEHEMLLSLIERCNRLSEASLDDDADFFNPEPESEVGLHICHSGNGVNLHVNTRSRNIGFYDPILGYHLIFPELLHPAKSEQELWTIQKIINRANQAYLDEFNESSDFANRTDFNHPLVKQFLEYSNKSLRKSGLAQSIVDSYNDNQLDPGKQIGFDDFSLLAVCLQDMHIGLHQSIFNAKLSLRITGGYKRKNNILRRSIVEHIDIAERTSNSIDILEFEAINHVATENELEELIKYVEFAKDISKVVPKYSPRTLGIQLSPGQTLTLD